MVPRAGLNRFGKFRLHQDSIPGPFSQQPVGIPSELPGLPFLIITVTKTVFTNSAFSGQFCVKTTELNENPRNSPVADTTSQPDGHDLDIRGLMCSGDVWGVSQEN
jgi:hypothetical protein